MNNTAVLQQKKATLNPIAWVKNLYEKYKQSQDDLMKKKIDLLYKNTYKFYLDLYLTGVQQNNLIDFHPAAYRLGITKSALASQLAMERMVEVIKEGRVNECYSNLTKYRKAHK